MRSGSRGKSLRTGFIVGVTNPKTLVFFVAFLPQFVDAGSGHVGLQMTVLGVVFGAMAICSDSIWALAASRARDWFSRKPDAARHPRCHRGSDDGRPRRDHARLGVSQR